MSILAIAVSHVAVLKAVNTLDRKFAVISGSKEFLAPFPHLAAQKILHKLPV